ncbi:glyoxylase-like metal-dependent hydrolase (beta-lactamase superfamily II)/ACT domain-containing protein [Methanofollis sp. W23]|uniref:ACT domain-containing protein n=1 Tax=Methanofollis sp. W23 TaxID=2817849 RepID=UPI001AEAE31C|nr:ACT domain-containing protein [Methanofollis sp. W23]MBP2144927.1 glyoxylase-like metal-dependent hydrolase (beta-lactamase superfamily II)/ACT domain-containing protein [Methanofollis sp. W23]
METREEKFSFIARMPDRPGALQQAAAIVTEHGGNINRIQYSRRIDPRTVFFEVTAPNEAHATIRQRLAAIGYLQTALPGPGILRFHVHLPHTPGALAAFLDLTTEAGANIALIDFDDAGPHPDRVTVSVSLEERGQAEALLDALKSRYPLEILEYDTTGSSLDETVFYLCFAQQVREIIGPAGDGFLLRLLHDINHVVQELTARGEDPRAVFASVLQTGESLRRTCGEGFYADVQQVAITPEMDLFCFQLPGGGNVYLLHTAEESMMIDTGYGIYYPDIIRMLTHYGLGNGTRLKRILLTHADADHCGATGFYEAPAMMHPTSAAIIETSNRAFASPVEGSVLEMVYTTIINLFSRFNPPENYTLFDGPTGEVRGIFPVIHRVTFGGLEFEVLEGFGGHVQGLIYVFCPRCGLLFTSDTVINFGSLTEERKTYSSLADFLVTSVNVDSATARRERRALMEIAARTDQALAEKGRRCYVCGGHGAVSVLDADGRLEAVGEVEHYTHQG